MTEIETEPRSQNEIKIKSLIDQCLDPWLLHNFQIDRSDTRIDLQTLITQRRLTHSDIYVMQLPGRANFVRQELSILNDADESRSIVRVSSPQNNYHMTEFLINQFKGGTIISKNLSIIDLDNTDGIDIMAGENVLKSIQRRYVIDMKQENISANGLIETHEITTVGTMPYRYIHKISHNGWEVSNTVAYNETLMDFGSHIILYYTNRSKTLINTRLSGVPGYTVLDHQIEYNQIASDLIFDLEFLINRDGRFLVLTTEDNRLDSKLILPINEYQWVQDYLAIE